MDHEDIQRKMAVRNPLASGGRIVLIVLALCLVYFFFFGRAPGDIESGEPNLRFVTDVMDAVENDGPQPTDATYPAMTIASSEYPSWAALGTAGRRGLIDPRRGKYGPIERKYHVDIVLVFKDYDVCLSGYGQGVYDAICVTNVDIIPASMGRPAVAYCPTSTSDGGDALVGLGWKEPDDPAEKGRAVRDFLRGKKVYGANKSVSEYVFAAGLERYGLDPSEFRFAPMQPAQAAQLMQQGQEGVDAIMVWNPFIQQTLKTFTPQKPPPGIVFTSHEIPGEVVDMMVIASSSYAKPGGKRFCAATAEAFYSVCRLLEDENLRDAILVDLGKSFANLDASEMALCLQATHFYSRPEEGIKVFSRPRLRATMIKVVNFCRSHGMLTKDQNPLVSFP